MIFYIVIAVDASRDLIINPQMVELCWRDYLRRGQVASWPLIITRYDGLRHVNVIKKSDMGFS